MIYTIKPDKVWEVWLKDSGGGFRIIKVVADLARDDKHRGYYQATFAVPQFIGIEEMFGRGRSIAEALGQLLIHEGQQHRQEWATRYENH